MNKIWERILENWEISEKSGMIPGIRTVEKGTRLYKNTGSTRRYKAVQELYKKLQGPEAAGYKNGTRRCRKVVHERYKKVQGGIRPAQEGIRLYKICLDQYIPVHTGTK